MHINNNVKLMCLQLRVFPEFSLHSYRPDCEHSQFLATRKLYFSWLTNCEHSQFLATRKLYFSWLTAPVTARYSCYIWESSTRSSSITKSSWFGRLGIASIAPRSYAYEAGCIICDVLHSRTFEIDNMYCNQELKLKLIYDRPTVGQSVSESGTHLGSAANFSFSLKFLSDSCGFVIL
jgi:hypothetical protein